MSKINVEEILKKHYVQRGDELQQIKLRMALREIVDKVVDKCAKKAKVAESTQEVLNLAGVPYRNDIDKQSILAVKEEVDYE